jgi:hypothetical protein
VIRRFNMKTFMTVLFAGAMLASTTFAAASDPLAEERFKMKTGRYTPAEEARLQVLTKKTEAGGMDCEHTCCRSARVRSHEQHTNAAPAWAEQVFNAKLGRNTAAEEARLLVAKARGKHGEAASNIKAASDARANFVAAWLQAKLGRSIPAADDRLEARRPQVIAENPEVPCASMCKHTACCD